jgi:Methyltransferase domain
VGLVRATIGGFLRTFIRPLGAKLQFTRDDVPGLHATGTGIEYWRDGLERRMPRWWELTWRGRVIMRVRSHHNERAYWRRRRDLIRLIEEMNLAALLPLLQSHSLVLEPGCNVAQNLWEISQRWNCEIYGLDIDREGLEQASKRSWLKPAYFSHGNVLEPGTLARFSDRQFDLVLTRWHLIHLPSGEPKTQYVQELKRIGKAGLILEPTAPEKTGQIEWAQKGRYCLSWDDWERWYRLKRFVPKVAIPYTDVFYW